MAPVSLCNLTKQYAGGTLVAVDRLNLDVADGEFLVLVGPSGCGKSTALKMIAGLEEISGGEVRIGGEVVNDLAARDRDIAMIFQSYALYPHMSVFDNIAFPLQIAKLPKPEIAERVQQVARTLQLEDYLGRKPGKLSGGQRQRVAMGRAIIRRPAVFLMDEPLSNLDAKLRGQMRSEIAQLQDRLGVTTIYVTHDQVEAMTLGQRIVVLDDGVIQQIDTPMALYRRPANLFVAGFLGSPSMNLLRGTLHVDGGLALATAHGTIRLGEPPQAPALRAWRDREVVLGLRPEDLHPLAAGDPGAALEARLEVLEPVGNEVFLNLRYGDQALVARTPPGLAASPGETMRFGLTAGRLHFFDPHEGTRIG